MERMPNESDGDIAEKIQLLMLLANPAAAAGAASPTQNALKYRQYMDEESGDGVYGVGRKLGLLPGLGAAVVADIGETLIPSRAVDAVGGFGRGVVGATRTDAPAVLPKPSVPKPAAPVASPTSDTIAALEAMIRMSGGRGRGGSLGLDTKAIKDDDAKDQALVDGALAHLRASRGAVADSIRARAVPEVFDAAGEDARIRAANPFTKKERTNVFALPMWDAKSNSFVQNPNAVAGAKHLADVGAEEQTLHDKRLAQLLGFGREAVTGRNIQQTARDTNAIEANKVNMPTELDMGLIRQQMKGDTTRAMAVARANAEAMRGGKDDAITQMLRAYKNKAEAEKSKDPKLVAIADKVIEMLSPKKAQGMKPDELLKLDEAFRSTGLPLTEKQRYAEWIAGNGSPAALNKYAQKMEAYAKNKNPKVFEME